MTKVLGTALALFAAILFSATSATAQQSDGPVVQHIDVQGNQRIEESTVLSYMVLREGQAYSQQQVDQSLKTLYGTGLFADVQILQSNGNVTVKVVENPIINRIAFEGNSKVSQKTLEEEVQLKPRMVFTRAKVQSDVSRIIEIYRRSGRFAAQVEPKTVQLAQNRVDLVFEVNEGPTTGVSRIIIIGNKEFSDSTLRDKIATGESVWWNFLQSNDNYDPDRLTFDREQLRRFYLSQGYADFRVISAVAELAPDRSGFYITFTIEEGLKYNFGKVEVDTKLKDIQIGDLQQLIRFEGGEQYNAELIDKSVDALTLAAGTKGYAFVDIRPRVRRNKESQTVDVVFKIEEGPRVYIERINIVGNTRTLDKVIRREVRLVEGDAFNRVLINRSRSRIRGLGFFKKVEITEEPGASNDRTVLNVEVEEQSTGEFSVSAGFSSADNIVGAVSLTEKNLLGRGQFLRLQVSISGIRQQVDLRFTEPYFLDRNMSAGFDLYNTHATYDQSNYESDIRGVGLRLGFPLSEFGRLGLRYTLRQDDIRLDTISDGKTYQTEGVTLLSFLGYTYAYDEKDDPIEPKNGFDFMFSQDLAGLGGDKEYVKTELSSNWYKRLWFDELVLNVAASAGYIVAYGDDTLELNDRFYKGGGSFRGFKTSGIGPRDISEGPSVTPISLGGEAYAIGTVELRFPNFLPDELGIKTSLFSDFGTVGLVADDAGTCVLRADVPTPNPTNIIAKCIKDDLSLRASAGVSVYWNSPFGPVRLDFSQILNIEDYDKTETFRFSAGTKF
ncbi:MAG: outer membrane protein assembly factor BamA [Alphaproteobacteria bacterium]|nr:outer membrane protein assembly factor BamA [Alphaproteobacteria bacterium]